MITPKIYYTHAGLLFMSLAIHLCLGRPNMGQSPPPPTWAEGCPTIPRTLPPEGLPIAAEQATAWWDQIKAIQATIDAVTDPSGAARKADVEVLLKACRMAIEFRELYNEKDFAKVDRVLDLAEQRAAELQQSQPVWITGAGLQVRGFRSQVDGAVQPVGLVLPQQWSQSPSPLPLYVWLHGRGDKTTDLHFICERLDNWGEVVPEGAIVLHPFGRQCIGYKSAGETDVLEAIEFTCENYPVDRQRIVLMGFSMGGAGAWHLAAHYPERFVAVSPGAGFAETARYQNLRPDQYPPPHVQRLWSIYDVPGYTRQLFNLPVVAYSGELDKQIQAARVMEEAFEAEGRTLNHIIGPGMGHKYHPEALAEILKQMSSAVEAGQPADPEAVTIHTRHPRYARYRWLSIDGVAEGYEDTRATATRAESGVWHIETQNATRLAIAPTISTAGKGTGQPVASRIERVIVDGTALAIDPSTEALLSRSTSGEWKKSERFETLRKHPRLSGPIDDAFIDPFLVVIPSGRSSRVEVERWIQCELAQFKQRWRMVFRGEPRIKRVAEVTWQDMQDYHLVLWGEPATNRLLHSLLAKPSREEHSLEFKEATDGENARNHLERSAAADAPRLPAAAPVVEHLAQLPRAFDLPLTWTEDWVKVGDAEWSAAEHVLVAIYPNPWVPTKYIVLNSGPTFRAAHDRTNSLQNPQLPDWALIGLDELPSAERPGRIGAAGFFDESWQPQ